MKRSLRKKGSVFHLTQEGKFMKSNILQKTPIAALLALFCSALWGSAFPCVKIGYDLFGIDKASTPSIILFAGVRFFIAGIMVIIIGMSSQFKYFFSFFHLRFFHFNFLMAFYNYSFCHSVQSLLPMRLPMYFR